LRGILKKGVVVGHGQGRLDKRVRFGKKVKMVFGSEIGSRRFAAMLREKFLTQKLERDGL
jgi:hypothetical protein